MNPLNPTGPRLALMRAIVNQPGSVAYRRMSNDRDEVVWGYQIVTHIYDDFDQAGLVSLGRALGPVFQAVMATPAGRTWLAEHDKETTR